MLCFFIPKIRQDETHLGDIVSWLITSDIITYFVFDSTGLVQEPPIRILYIYICIYLYTDDPFQLDLFKVLKPYGPTIAGQASSQNWVFLISHQNWSSEKTYWKVVDVVVPPKGYLFSPQLGWCIGVTGVYPPFKLTVCPWKIDQAPKRTFIFQPLIFRVGC